MRVPKFLVAIVAAEVVLTLQRLTVAQTVVKAIDEMGQRIAERCKEGPYTPVVLKFGEPIYELESGMRLENSARMEIASRFAEKLREKGLEVRRASGKSAVLGTIRFADRPGTASPANRDYLKMTLGAELQDSRGNVLEKLNPLDVTDRKDLTRLLGLPVSEKSPSGRPTLAEIAKVPQSVDSSGRVKANENSEFALQILVNGVAVPAEVEDGLAFADLKLGDEFTVKVFNDWSHEVAVVLTVDGIHWRHRTKVERSRLVAAGESTVFKAWQIDDVKTRAFKIVPEEDSVARELGIVEQMGVIQAQIFGSYKEGEEPIAPDTLPTRPPGRVVVGKRPGVGEGTEGEQPTVVLPRVIAEQPRAAIPVRYIRP